jgi:hypothetical protein
MPVPAEHLERILNRIHDWTRSADNKVGVLAGAEAALLVYVLPKIEKWWQTPQPFLTYLALLASTALMLTGAACALTALFPRDTNPSRRKSVTFFGDVAHMTLDEFRRKVDEMDEGQIRSDYVSQIHVSSVIARKKHRLLRLSVGCFTAGIVLLGLLRVVVAFR